MSLASGQRLGSFEVLERIGAGGMGEVWKGRDTRLDRIVAIKTSQAQFGERFEREARSIAGLNHPHICTLYDVGVTPSGESYLVMEYIEGKVLEGPLPLREALRVGAEIADALAAAHRKGITHRDLKPGNVLVTKSGAKLLDFGLAKWEARGDPATAETAAGAVFGTPSYTAPEQLEGKERAHRHPRAGGRTL